MNSGAYRGREEFLEEENRRLRKKVERYKSRWMVDAVASFLVATILFMIIAMFIDSLGWK